MKFSPIRGSLWLIKPGAASRIGVPKVRPWLILQDDVFAAYEGRIACYLTSVANEQGKPKKVRDSQIPFTHKQRASYICCDSLYTIKNGEFLRHVGDIDAETMIKVSIALHMVLGTSEIILP